MTKAKDPLREAAEAFISAFAVAGDQGKGQHPGDGLTMGASGLVPITTDLAKAHHDLVRAMEKDLGPKHAHEPSLRSEAWSIAHKLRASGKCDASQYKAVLEGLKTAKVGDHRLLFANSLWSFPPSATSTKISVGPVSVAHTLELAKLEPALTSNSKVKLGGDPNFEVLAVVGTTLIQLDALGPQCWLIDVNCAAENLREEARWLADMATSLLRLAAANQDDIVPTIGEIELRPFDTPTNLSRGVRVTGTAIAVGGAKHPGSYRFATSVHERVQDPGFQIIASRIFSPPAKSLAGRVAQALGWLSRGRQSLDHSERLLSFFTALEAMLSDKNVHSPVTDTIARRAGVIWSDDPETRRDIATRLRRLYGVRSLTVHNGARNALSTDVNELQFIVEVVCSILLRSKGLAEPEQGVFDGLTAATYGSVWKGRPSSTMDNQSESSG